MKTKFKFIYRSGYRCGTMHLCADEVQRLFGVERKAVDLMVSTVKPRGDDYYVATLHGTRHMPYYTMTKSESGKYVGYSDWPIALDRQIMEALRSTKKVYFWMEQ